MKTYKTFVVVINHPAFGRISTAAEFDGQYVTFGSGAHTVRLYIKHAIERDMKQFDKMNVMVDKTDKMYVDISTMQLFDVNIDGQFVSLRYVFDENWYNGEKCGGRCAQGDLYKWHQSSEDRRIYNVTRPVFGVDAAVAW